MARARPGDPKYHGGRVLTDRVMDSRRAVPRLRSALLLMAVLIDLIIRELLFLALVTALGAGPAAFLSDAYDRCARTAMAPVLGLCLGVCLTVTAIYFVPARDTAWLLLVAAALSIGVAARRRRPRWRRPSRRDIAQVLIVLIVVLVSFDYPLAGRGTVGPVGGYQISDTSGYVSETNGEQQKSIRQAEEIKPPYSDLSLAAWSIYAHGTQQLDITPLEADYDQLLGLDVTDTQSAFLIAVLAVGALGVFAVVRRARGQPTWGAVVAGCLFAGPMYVQLLMDGSQAAIAGSAVMVPAVALGVEALRDRRTSNLVLFGLSMAGLQTVYPLFVPCMVIGAVILIVVLVTRALRRRAVRAAELPARLGALAAVLALSVVLSPVAFSRNVHYWLHILDGTISFAGLPQWYVFPVTVLPGWLLQTRDFYGLVDLTHGTASQLLLIAVLPLGLLAVIALGIWRNRIGLALLAVAFGACVLAYYTVTSESCSYCEQRNLIPVGALAAGGIGMGLAALAAMRWRWAVWAAAAVGVVTVLVIGHEGIVLRERLAHGDYILDPGDRRAVGALPANPGPVELEGFSESGQAPAELPLVYNLLEQRIGSAVSLPTIVDDHSGLAYLIGGPAPFGPSFVTNYQYVLTRLAEVATGRRTIARYGSIALQRRVGPLDVTPISGLSVAPARLDPRGTAWVNRGEPLEALVVGGSEGQPAWLTLTFHATVPVRLPRGPALVSSRRTGDELRVCLRALGNAPVRSVGLQPAFTPQDPPAALNPYDPPQPARGLRLQAMKVSTRSCSRL